MDVRLIITLALRNLLRNVRRTVITSGAIVAGVAVLIMGLGLVDGLDENVIRAQEDALVGHVVLRPDGWPTAGLALPLDEARPVPTELAAALDADPQVTGWTTRLWFDARAIKGVDGMRVRAVSFDPAREDSVFPRSGWELRGGWPAADAGDEVVVGSWLGRLLELEAGDDLVLEARTRSGAMNALMLRVTGVVSTGTPSADRALWVPRATATELVAPGERVSHVLVRLQRRTQAAAAAARHSGDGWVGDTARDEAADILAINAFRRRAISGVVLILMLIAATGITNTVVMAAYERVREVGTLQAMGMSGGGIQALFLVEGGLLGLFAGLVGAALGSSVVQYFSVYGIDLSGAADQVGDFAISTTLYLSFAWPPVFAALAFGVGVSLVASVFPARRAAALNPADAVRAE